jgi:hypothetical protein
MVPNTNLPDETEGALSIRDKGEAERDSKTVKRKRTKIEDRGTTG